ncbi:hypothetical protein [Saccharolobus solfataricus]|uniref:hypothetical protein n=1 Tax=Saccharolobus solfataricus TaxID=2287 RepID=UPI0005FCD023|nr:hypothetical protein [Saccharolobus solfataricus]
MQSTNLLDVATNVATLMFRANPNANFVRYQSPSFQTSIYSIYLMMKLGDFKSNFISFFSKYFSQNIILTIWNLVNNYALDDIIRIILYSIFIYTNLQNIPNTYIQKINNFSSFLYFAPKSTISVTEFHGGLSKSSNYYFLIDGNNLQHLMAFAVPGSVQKIGFKNPEVLYNVYINDIYDKCVVEFSSSNSGPFSNIEVFPAIDLVLPFDLRRASRKPITYLNNFNFKWITTNEMSFLRKQWTQVYMQMINSIKSISSTLSSLLKYPPIFPSLLNIQMAGINFPLSFLIPYNINARQKSLEGLMKEIHQIWIMLQIITYLKNQARLKLLNLDFSQSSSNPIAIFSCNGQDCSLWYEFDMNPHTMCRGLLWNLNSGPSCSGVSPNYFI